MGSVVPGPILIRPMRNEFVWLMLLIPRFIVKARTLLTRSQDHSCSRSRVYDILAFSS